MNPDRFARLAELFDQAVELDAQACAALIERLRAEDASLASELIALLAADTAPQPLLDEPIGLHADDESGVGGVAQGGKFGQFRLVREIGSGGMGVVWLAERDDEELRQWVALKLIRPGLDSILARRRFRRERAILASLQHPNIAHLIDAGIEVDGRPWFAMEYVEGEPLTHYANDRNLSLAERLRLFVSVCRAVQFAHGRLVVHRDIKPTNILVDAHAAPKLLDFGIARLLDADSARDSAHEPAVLGLAATPNYAAPEQLRGEAASVASDIYALGVVLFELLANSLPWPRGIRDLTAIEQPPPRASQLATGQTRQRALRGDLDAILTKALATNPATRYASADAFADDLERHLVHQPVRARIDTRVYRAAKLLRRHGVAIAAGVTVAFALLLGSGISLWQAHQARLEAKRADSVRNFLTDLFAIADPNLTQGREVTARELLREGARRVSLAPDSNPMLVADIDAVIGKLANDIGDYDTAATRLREAQTALLRAGNNPQRLAQVRVDLANTTRRNGDLAQAQKMLEALLADRVGLDPAIHASALTTLAQVFSDLNEAKSGEPLAEQALALDLARGTDTEAVARDRNVLAELAYAKLDFPTAVTRWQEVLSIRRGLHGELHTSVAQAHRDVGAALAGAGDLAGAATELQTAYESFSALLGAEHPAVASTLIDWGGALRQNGEFDKAEPKYREAIAINEKVLGADHPETLRGLNSLGALLAQRGRDAESIAVLERVLAGVKQAYGDSNGQLVPTLITLAGLASRSGDYVGSVARYRQAIEIADTAFGPDNPRSDVARRGLGATLALTGDTAAGVPLLREALANHLKRYDEHHPEVIVFRITLAQVLAASGEIDEAESIINIADASAREVLPPAHPFRVYASMVLARIDFSQGKLAQAAQILASLDAEHAAPYAPYFRSEYTLLDLQIRAAQGDSVARSELVRDGNALLAKLPPLLRGQSKR